MLSTLHHSPGGVSHVVPKMLQCALIVVTIASKVTTLRSHTGLSQQLGGLRQLFLPSPPVPSAAQGHGRWGRWVGVGEGPGRQADGIRGGWRAHQRSFDDAAAIRQAYPISAPPPPTNSRLPHTHNGASNVAHLFLPPHTHNGASNVAHLFLPPHTHNGASNVAHLFLPPRSSHLTFVMVCALPLRGTAAPAGEHTAQVSRSCPQPPRHRCT
jgi:hypothetical protein